MQTPPAPEPLPKNIPVVEKKDGPGGGVIPKHEDFKGKYVRSSDGETYALAVVPGDINGRTHKAMNSEHYWEGTYEQFKKEFIEEGDDDKPTVAEKTKADYEARDKARKERESDMEKAEKAAKKDEKKDDKK